MAGFRDATQSVLVHLKGAVDPLDILIVHVPQEVCGALNAFLVNARTLHQFGQSARQRILPS